MPSPLRFVPNAAKLWKDPGGQPIAMAEVTTQVAPTHSKIGRTRFQTPTALSDFELPKFALKSTLF